MLSFWWKPLKDSNIKPLEQKIQQLEQADQTINQKLQQLEQTNNSLNNLVQNLNQQIQNLTNQLTTLTNNIQPIIADWRHVVKANQTNNFQATQKITALNSALQFVHGANETGYIEFKRDNGTTRGYLGAGQSRTNRMDLVGLDEVLIESQNEGITLNAHPNFVIGFQGAREVNFNNIPLTGLPDPTNQNQPFTWNYLTRRIKKIEGNWRQFSNQKEFVWPNIPGGVYEVLNFEAGYGTNPNFKSPVQIFDWVVENNNNTLKFKGQSMGSIPGVNQTLYVKMTYITAR